MTRFKGDNWQAFDGSPIEVEYDTGGKPVSKAIFVINKGVIVKEYTNPTNPFYVELTETETRKLSSRNICNLILFDSNNRKETCDDTVEFYLNDEVYNANESQV